MMNRIKGTSRNSLSSDSSAVFLSGKAEDGVILVSSMPTDDNAARREKGGEGGGTGVSRGALNSPYRWGLTTSANAGGDPILIAQGLAERFGVPFLLRNQSSLGELRHKYDMDFLVTVDRNRHVYVEEPLLRWHPAMAIPRFRRLAEGGDDIFLTAAALEEGDVFLDCTLGLGADTLLAAWAVGETGRVTGLEASPIIAMVTKWGLEHEALGYDRRKAPMKTAASRISVKWENALLFLRAQKDNSWDTVYFDPMFRSPKALSSGMNNLRPFACYEPFGADTLAESLRVCRKRVILKERWFSPLFQDLGAHRTIKTKYGPVAYGVWEKGDA